MLLEPSFVNSHSSGYLGMVVQHCVRAYLGPHYLDSEAIINGTAEFYSLFFLPLYVYFEAIKTFL